MVIPVIIGEFPTLVVEAQADGSLERGGQVAKECSADGQAAAPVTLVELALNGTGGMDLYEVSLVNGFNIPVMVEPWDLTCRARGCVKDLNVACPKELKVVRNGEGVACKKVCQSEPCLSSHFFKTQCPFTHVDAYDHASFNCASAHYIITFCPASSPSWPKPENKRYPAAAPPAVVNSGGDHRSLIKVIAAAVLALTSACGFYLVCKVTIHCHLCTNTANQVQPQAETTLEIEIQPVS